MDIEREEVRHSTVAERSDIESLRRIELFRDASDRDLAALAEAAVRRVYQRGQVIVHVGDRRDGLFAIVEGDAGLYRSSIEGREILLATFTAGDIFRPSFLSPRLNPKSTFEATTDGTVAYWIPREALRRFAASHPDTAVRVLDLMDRRILALCDLIEELALCNVTARLAHTLAQLAEPEGDRLIVRETHQQLAARIGARRDELTKAVRRLREEGLVRTSRGRRGIIVLDRERLASYGNGST